MVLVLYSVLGTYMALIANVWAPHNLTIFSVFILTTPLGGRAVEELSHTGTGFLKGLRHLEIQIGAW